MTLSQILAKPSGITLDVHTDNVIQEGNCLISNLSATESKYSSFTGKPLSQRLKLACKYHDQGKSEKRWQSACFKDFTTFSEWKKTSNQTYLDFSKSQSAQVGNNIRNSGVRHELYSLILLSSSNPPPWLIVAIAAHHRKLSKAHQHRWTEFAGAKSHKELIISYWKQLCRLSNKAWDDRLPLKDIALSQFEFAGPRGLLRLSDHRASAKEDGVTLPNIGCFEYTFPSNWIKRPIQELVEKHWKEDLLLLRAPTGAGKTDASLLWASLQIKNNRADRLIIAMPTRFTSNALAVNISTNLADTGLYHSSAWQTNFGTQIQEKAIAWYEAKNIHEQARLFLNTTTVCTIDHLLTSLTLTREDDHLVTFNLANSCLVIDEADFYDDFTQANILVLLEILHYWKVPVLIMSASLPNSVVKDYQRIGYNQLVIREDRSDYHRDRFEIIERRNAEDPEEIADLLSLCLSEGNAIIYANTVDRAQKYYKWFVDRTNNINVVLYHSRFTEPDKYKKECELISMLGREAWERGEARGIAILTQIGEMSVNISADIMVSDLCPIDRLTQRAGRMCRFDQSKVGRLYIVNPQKGGKQYPAPYGSFSQKEKIWVAHNPITLTSSLLKENYKYSAETLVALINEVYPDSHQFSPKAIENSDELKKYFTVNWLINPEEESDVEFSETNFWKARDIDVQMRVYTQSPVTRFFRNFTELKMWETEYSVELSAWLAKNALESGAIHLAEVMVGAHKMILYILDPLFYSYDLGVHFSHSNKCKLNYEII